MNNIIATKFMTGTPHEGGTYLVEISNKGYDKRYIDVGYWSGIEWEMMHEMSEYRSVEYTFDDYGMTIHRWAPLPKTDETLLVEAMDDMCVESISPEKYEWWKQIKDMLYKNRQHLDRKTV